MCAVVSPHLPHPTTQPLCHIVIDLARLIVAFAPQSLHTKAGLGELFMDALLKASDWDEHWTPPMTKPKERNILLLLRTIANALQENAKFENITWALKIFAEPLPNELFTSPQRIVGSTLLLKYVDSPRLFCAVW